MGLSQRPGKAKEAEAEEESVIREASMESTTKLSANAQKVVSDVVNETRDTTIDTGDTVALRQIGSGGPLHWIFAGKVSEQARELGEANVNVLRWGSRCEGITAFWSFLFVWSAFLVCAWNYSTGHMMVAQYGLGSLLFQVTMIFLLWQGAKLGWLSPDNALTAFGFVNCGVVFISPAVVHIIHGGGYHSANVLFGNLLAPPSALFHLRLPGGNAWGVGMIILRTAVTFGLLVFDSYLPPRDGLVSGLHHISILIAMHTVIALAFVYSLWKAMKRMTEQLHGMEKVIAARKNKEEANELLICSLCPPERRSRLSQVLEDPEDYTLASSNWVCHEPEEFTQCTLLQMDIKGFTALSSEISATELVDLINAIFTSIDEAANIVDKVWKVETVGDCYKAAIGGILPCEDHGQRAVALGLAIIEIVQGVSKRTQLPLSVRCGVATGPVTGAIMGTRLPRFLLHGATCELVGVLESTAEAGSVQCTPDAAAHMERFCALQEREVELPRGGTVRTKSVGLCEDSRRGMVEAVTRGQALERLMSMFRPRDDDLGFFDPAPEELDPALRRSPSVAERSETLRATLNVLEQEFVHMAPVEVIQTPRGIRSRRRSLFFSSVLSGSFRSQRSVDKRGSLFNTALSASSQVLRSTSGGSSTRSEGESRTASGWTVDERENSALSDDLARHGSSGTAASTEAQAEVPPVRRGHSDKSISVPRPSSPDRQVRRGSSERSLGAGGGLHGGLRRASDARQPSPAGQGAERPLLLGARGSHGSFRHLRGAWSEVPHSLRRNSSERSLPSPTSNGLSPSSAGLLTSVLGHGPRGAQEDALSQSTPRSNSPASTSSPLNCTLGPRQISAKKLLSDPPTHDEVAENASPAGEGLLLTEADWASVRRRTSVMSTPLSQLADVEEEPDEEASHVSVHTVTPLDGLEEIPGELDAQVSIHKVLLAGSLLGCLLHAAVLLLAAEGMWGGVGAQERSASSLRAAAVPPAAMAAVLTVVLWKRLHWDTVMEGGDRRELARNVVYAVLCAMPLVTTGAMVGPLVQSCVLWALQPLLLLVRCVKGPTWTAFAAWAVYILFVFWTHLGRASVEHVQYIASSEQKLGLWTGGDAAWVGALYVVNVLLPTTLVLYPYYKTAQQTSLGVSKYEEQHVGLDLESELQRDLLSMLVPRPIAERLQQGEERVADQIEDATVLFVYIRDVDQLVADHGAADCMIWLNKVFERLDSCVSAWACQTTTAVDGQRGSVAGADAHVLGGINGGLTGENSVLKVETFNNFYLAISGVAYRPEEGKKPPLHVDEAVRVALEMAQKACAVVRPDGQQTSLKIGLNSGSVCAGVISTSAPRFSIFGDTVNVASRMASNARLCEHGKVYLHMSDATASGISEHFKTWLDELNYDLYKKELEMEIKGKGMMQTWCILRHEDEHEDLSLKKHL